MRCDSERKDYPCKFDVNQQTSRNVKCRVDFLASLSLYNPCFQRQTSPRCVATLKQFAIEARQQSRAHICSRRPRDVRSTNQPSYWNYSYAWAKREQSGLLSNTSYKSRGIAWKSVKEGNNPAINNAGVTARSETRPSKLRTRASRRLRTWVCARRPRERAGQRYNILLSSASYVDGPERWQNWNHTAAASAPRCYTKGEIEMERGGGSEKHTLGQAMVRLDRFIIQEFALDDVDGLPGCFSVDVKASGALTRVVLTSEVFWSASIGRSGRSASADLRTLSRDRIMLSDKPIRVRLPGYILISAGDWLMFDFAIRSQRRRVENIAFPWDSPGWLSDRTNSLHFPAKRSKARVLRIIRKGSTRLCVVNWRLEDSKSLCPVPARELDVKWIALSLFTSFDAACTKSARGDESRTPACGIMLD